MDGDGGQWQWLLSVHSGISWDMQALIWPGSLAQVWPFHLLDSKVS